MSDSTPRETPPIGRTEAILAIVLVLLALGLRSWDLGRTGVDHFDEAVYVFSALGLSDSAQPLTLYPKQHLFAPPLWSGLLAGGSLVFGASATLAVALNALLGTGTVLLLWIAGRRWFDPATGIAAAALLAMNEFHISLGRTALSDVAFAFFFLLAVILVTRALERPCLGRTVLGGLAVGLAWNTKYHGWLSLLVVAIAVLALLVRMKANFAEYRRYLFQGAVMAGVAGLCYLPWALFVQLTTSGYEALARYQSGFLSLDWTANLRTQIDYQLWLEGPFTRTAPLVAILGASLVPGRSRAGSAILGAAGLALVAGSVGGTAAVAVAALVALPFLLAEGRRLPPWVALAWLAILFLITPIYRPYARLALPLIMAVCLVGAIWISRLAGAVTAPIRAGLAAAALAVAAIGVFAHSDPSDPWRPSDSFEIAAAKMTEVIPEGARTVVFGEPAVAYYLHLRGRPAFEFITDKKLIANLDQPVYVVGGVYADRTSSTRDALAAWASEGRLVKLGEYPADPKDIRVLDDFSPGRARRFRAEPDDTYLLDVFRLDPQER